MERLEEKEKNDIIMEMKEKGIYEKYRLMILDDFEDHRVVYKLPEEEMIALAYKKGVTPYMMKEYYDWFEMNLLTEEDDYGI